MRIESSWVEVWFLASTSSCLSSYIPSIASDFSVYTLIWIFNTGITPTTPGLRRTYIPAVSTHNKMFPVPPELSQIIIDQLWDDTISLRAICLVSKAAIPFCRRHLFYEVKFHFQNRTESTKLLDVLKSRTKPGEHVRSLWLVSSSPYQDDMSTKYKVNISNRKGQQTEKEDRDMIQEAMAHIRLIREIHVENAPGEILGSYYSPGLLPRLRQVAIATFRGVTFVSLANFVDTLSYIPHCHSLRLENIAFGRENVSEVVDDDGRITPLRTLYLGLMSKGAFIEWMLASSSQSQRYTGSGPGLNITTLILKHITSNEGAVIKKLLRCLGTTLERLDINLAMDVAGGYSLDSINDFTHI